MSDTARLTSIDRFGVCHFDDATRLQLPPWVSVRVCDSRPLYYLRVSGWFYLANENDTRESIEQSLDDMQNLRDAYAPPLATGAMPT